MSSSGGVSGHGKAKSAKVVSRSSKAGIQFHIGCIVWYHKTDKYAECAGPGDPTNLSTKVLELAGNTTMDNKNNRIMSWHVQLAVKNDEELSKLLGTITITDGSVTPNIHQAFFSKKDDGKGISAPPPRSSEQQSGGGTKDIVSCWCN